MTLPKLNRAKYSVEIPSTSETYYFTPFLAKHQQAILEAMEFGKLKDLVVSLMDIMNDCLEGKLDVFNLPFFDVIYIFTQIRAKSSGDTIDLSLKCNYCNNPDNAVKEELDLLSLKVDRVDECDPKIEITDEIGVIMKYPTLLELVDDKDTPASQIISIIVKYIKTIYTAEEVIDASTVSVQEKIEFVENLKTDQFHKINRFFRTMPNITKKYNYVCPNCGKENTAVLEGLDDFLVSKKG